MIIFWKQNLPAPIDRHSSSCPSLHASIIPHNEMRLPQELG